MYVCAASNIWTFVWYDKSLFPCNKQSIVTLKTEKQHELVPLVCFCKKCASKSSVLHFLPLRIDITVPKFHMLYVLTPSQIPEHDSGVTEHRDEGLRLDK